MKRHENTVANFIRKYKETNDYHHTSGSGRKRKISESDVNYMLTSIKRKRTMTLEELRQLVGGNKVSKWTVSRALNRSGRLTSVIQKRRPLYLSKTPEDVSNFANHISIGQKKTGDVFFSQMNLLLPLDMRQGEEYGNIMINHIIQV